MSNPGSPRVGTNGNTLPAMQYAEAVRTTGEQLASLVGASLTPVNDTIYVFGGFDQYSDEIYNTLYALEYKNSCKWKQVIYTKGQLPGKRTDHSATLWQGNKLVIFGGSSEEEDVHFNDIAVLDLTTMTWEHPETHGIMPEGRIRHSATIYDNKLYIAGGIHNSRMSMSFAETLLVLDLETWLWHPPIPFVCRAQHMSFMYDKRLYVFGGLREDMSRSNHLAFIDLDRIEDITQLEITSLTAPSISGQRFAQICGDQLIVLVTHPFREAMVEVPVTGLWSLDIPSLQWKRRELGTRYESCNWHCFAMTEHDPCFYLCGTTDEEPDEFYSMVLRVELDELGVIPVPPPQLGNDLIKLLIQQQELQQRNTDFTIRSLSEPNATPLQVHRLVLMARWPHFVHLIESGMEESVTNILTMSESGDILAAFVRFLYTDTLNDRLFTTELVCELLVMSHLYILPRLLALCLRRLFNELNIENASKIYHCASLSEQKGLQQVALQYIFQHFGAVSHTNGFRQLSRPILFQIWDYMPTNAAIVGQDNMLDNSKDPDDEMNTN
jgi:hypothetical protein